MNGLKRTPEQLKQRRHLTHDLCEAVLEDKTLLEYIMDEYVYLINDTKMEELQKIVDENFGEYQVASEESNRLIIECKNNNNAWETLLVMCE